VVSFIGGENRNTRRKASNNCKLLEKSHHIKEMFEDSKVEIRSSKWKDRQYNGQLKKYTLRVSRTTFIRYTQSQKIGKPNYPKPKQS
jgi:hypothetical protein